MKNWVQRARAHFLRELQNSSTETTESPRPYANERLKHTPKTTETPLSMVLTVQSGRFCEKHEFQNQGCLEASERGTTPNSVPIDDPDRWCSPHSTAMTGGEIDTFAARLVRFTIKGVIHADAESMANRLLQRDRGDDDRRTCLECTHLGGYGRASWRCNNWKTAGIVHRARDNQLPADLVLQLQRCDDMAVAT